MPDVVQQRSQWHDGGLRRLERREFAAIGHQAQRAACKVIDTERVIEAGVRRSRVDQVRVAQLLDVAEALEWR